jgi:membrane associated rhomboid family serine protease
LSKSFPSAPVLGIVPPLLMPFRQKRLRIPRPGANLHTLAPILLLLLSLPFLLSGGVNGPIAPLYDRFGLSREGVFENGHLWQLFSYAFLHGSFIHWASNAFFIYYFGGRLHDILGERAVWRVAFWSLLTGGVFHLAFQGANPLVGASGVGLGLFVALTTISPESRMFPLPLRARNLRNGVLLSSLIFLVTLPSLQIPLLAELGEILSKQGFAPLFLIGHACHLGGGLSGIVAMRRYTQKPITLAELKKERAAREEHDAA